jgi:HD domain-containing protein/GAF domain-containing protein
MDERGKTVLGRTPPHRDMTPAKRHRNLRLLAACALLGAAVFADELVNGRPLTEELTGDLVTAALLCAAGLILVSRHAGQRESMSQLAEEHRQARAIDEVVVAVSKGGHADTVLESLTRQACEILGVERSMALLRDPDDPRSSTVVAAHGVTDFVGRRFGIDEGMVGEAIITGEPVIAPDYPQFRRALRVPEAGDVHAGAAVPIRFCGAVRGGLSVVTTDSGRTFGQRDLEMLTRLGELGAVALEQAWMREQLERAVESGVEAMAVAVDIRDSYTAEHSDEVVSLARSVGERLGLEEDTLSELTFAARLHDVGKIGVPDELLHKNGELDDDEWQVMKQHPVWGAEMLGRIPGLRSVARIVRHGHERWDGDGYPDRLKRKEIPLESRIILACDAFQAMTSRRPYRDALRPWVAVSQLREGAGAQFDPEVIDALVAILREEAGSRMRLFASAEDGVRAA